MVKSATNSSPKKKKTTVRKAAVKPKAVAKKPAKKSVKKATVVSQKVDYYPNRMTVAVSALAGTVLVLVTLIAVLGVQ